MVTFRTCAVNLYQATRSERGAAWGRGKCIYVCVMCVLFITIEQSSKVGSTVNVDQCDQCDCRLQADKQSLPPPPLPPHTDKETSSTTSVPDSEETANSEVSDGHSEQLSSKKEGTMSQESDNTLQPGVATDEDNDGDGVGESGESTSEQEDEDGQNNDEDDKDGEREEEREDERKDERENEGDKDGEDSAQEKKPATASEPADGKCTCITDISCSHQAMLIRSDL